MGIVEDITVLSGCVCAREREPLIFFFFIMLNNLNPLGRLKELFNSIAIYTSVWPTYKFKPIEVVVPPCTIFGIDLVPVGLILLLNCSCVNIKS